MPNLPFEGMDPDEPGSRFTWRIALMVSNAVDGGTPSSDAEIENGVRSVVGDDVLDEDHDLGKPEIVQGGFGRGAEGFAAILEWLGSAAGGAVVGGMSWAAFTKVVEGARRLMSRIGEKDGRVVVSRGLAVALAADAVLAKHAGAKLSIEAADEPSAFAGHQTPELNYVAIEPWLVTMVDFDAKVRHVIVVRPNGTIAGMLEVPLEEYEPLYLPVPRRD